jgi:Tfp pilus assembly protein PilF
VHRALEAMAREQPSRSVSLYARALSAHVRLARGDTAGALVEMRRLLPTAPRDTLAWDLGEALPVERLRHAQLALARGDAAEALRVASLLDHPEPIAYLAFAPASLDLRFRAARALGRSDAAARYRERLRRLRAPPNVN